MTDTSLIKYLSQLSNLKKIAKESSQRVIAGDPLFMTHANVFVKSYLIMSCSVLEAYLKEEVLDYIEEVECLLAELKLTKNLLAWGMCSKQDDLYKKIVGNEIRDFSLSIDEKEIDDRLSANIDKTITTFRRCGVDITDCPTFAANKALIASIVNKRNAAVHHNDDASDVSFLDIMVWIDEIQDYMKGISSFISGVRETNADHLNKIKHSN
jgi:hypothetical protein